MTFIEVSSQFKPFCGCQYQLFYQCFKLGCILVQNVLLNLTFIICSQIFRMSAENKCMNKENVACQNILLLHCEHEKNGLFNSVGTVNHYSVSISDWMKQANVVLISQTLEVITIEITISCNSTTVKSSAQALVIILKTSPNIVLYVNSVRVMSAEVSTISDYIELTSTLNQSLEVELPVGTRIQTFSIKGTKSFMSTGLSHISYWVSAPTASQLLSIWTLNNSLWMTGGLKLTVQESSPFFKRASSWKFLKDGLNFLIIVWCTIGIFLQNW